MNLKKKRSQSCIEFPCILLFNLQLVEHRRYKFFYLKYEFWHPFSHPLPGVARLTPIPTQLCPWTHVICRKTIILILTTLRPTNFESFYIFYKKHLVSQSARQKRSLIAELDQSWDVDLKSVWLINFYSMDVFFYIFVNIVTWNMMFYEISVSCKLYKKRKLQFSIMWVGLWIFNFYKF